METLGGLENDAMELGGEKTVYRRLVFRASAFGTEPSSKGSTRTKEQDCGIETVFFGNKTVVLDKVTLQSGSA